MPDEQDKIDGDYQTVFGSEHGERVLRDLMTNSYFWDSTAEVKMQEPHVTILNEGKRSLILYILGRLRRKTQPVQKVVEGLDQSMADYPQAT